MVDEVSGLHSAQRLQTKRQVSMETVVPLQQARASEAIDSIHAMRTDLAEGIQRMMEFHAQLEQIHRELSPSK